MYNTSFRCIDRNIICSFFSNRNVIRSLDRLRCVYKNIIPLSFLAIKKWYALLIYYSKFYFRLK